LPQGIALDQVEIWFQDEHRIGQQGSLTRIWTRKGTRPRIVRQQQYLSAYLFGAVCPQFDKAAALVLPYVDTDSMDLHLQHISQAVSKEKHAILVLDGAGWHKSKELHIPKNITLLSLPPYSPELNPQEQLGRQLKHEHLANRSFDSYEDIISAICHAWNSFTSSPNRIRSLCSRRWFMA
jgi:transposase